MPRSRLSLAALIVTTAALLLSASPALAAERYELVLENRSYVPEKVRLAREEDSHLVIQFYEIPSEAQREELARAGVTLLDYIPNYAWTAHVRGGAAQALDAGLVRAVFELRAEDKIRRSATGQEVVRAFVYDGVEDAESVLTQYGSIIDQDRTGYTLVLEADVRELASENIVKCVMGPRPEMTVDNDDLRDNINADEVQTSPYDLHGSGLAAGIWDAGTAATNHDDYNSRLTLGDGSSTHSHATKCTGIMAGDGTRSSAEGGTPYQWRGVATGVDIISYDWPYDLTDMDTETGAAISSYDIVVSSNSWSWDLCSSYCYYFGTYDDYSWNFDRLVRGSEGKKLSIVFSAGNEGNCSGCSGDLPYYPYGTIPGPGSTAKNTICVGSNDADDDDLSYYSSMGPTLDGRLKPDIVAPGCKSYAGITTTYLSNDYYSSSCGTSFSCPAVAGCVVLTQEDYIDKFGGEAWPSTVKALLIQGAEDQGNVGPDFAFGYGRVNIQNTIDVIRADNGTGDLIKEDTLSPSETWEYEIAVTPGEDLKVTLVWDDYQGDYGAGGTMLVNDLDLELEAPGGGTYYPWVLNPTNPSQVATTGPDHLNNVEQVEVTSPTPGTWTIRVTATVMPEPNQDFSVVTNFAGGAPDLPPDAPTGLDADPGSGEGEIDVSWNPNSEPDLDHYRLERDDNPSFTSPASFVVYGTSYGDSGLTPGDTYWYRVYAVDAGSNESDPSGVASADATDLPPSAPTSLNAMTGAGEGEIQVVWVPSPEPDVVQYRLERADNPGFSGAVSFFSAIPDYTDSGLTPGDTYYYRAFAIDGGGHESGASNVDSAPAQDLPPAAPTGLVAVTGTGEGEIDISWSASPEPDFDRYRLERSTAPDFEPGSEPFEGAVASFTDTDLVPSELYYYRVYAIDEGGNVSSPSNVDSATALDLPPAPPTGLVAVTGVNEGEIDISWSASPEPDIDRYRLERSLAPDFEPGSEPFEEPAVSFTDTGLYPGWLYYYRVYAIDAGGNVSPPSNVDTALAQDLAPAAPTGLAVTTGADDGEIDLAWDANSELDIDHYRVERDEDPGFGSPDSFTEAGTSYADAGLVPGDVYYYRVYAVDAAPYESPASAPGSAPSGDPPPDACCPNFTVVPGAGEGDAVLDWDPTGDPDIDYYSVERRVSPSGTWGLVGTFPSTSATDSGLTPGETYDYALHAVDLTGQVGPYLEVVTYLAPDLAPAAPTGLTAVPGAGEGEIDVTWDANSESDFDHYVLERDTDPAFGSPDALTTTDTFYFDAGLTPSTVYHYRVFAVDIGLNQSPASGSDSATATDLLPATPTGLAAVPGGSDGEIDVTWDANSEPDLDSYVLERADNPGFVGLLQLAVFENYYYDSGLDVGTLYYYRIAAMDAGGNASPMTTPVSSYPYDQPPSIPTGLTVVTGSAEGEIDVSWTANPEPDIDHYKLERDITGGFTSPTFIDGLVGTSYTDPGLTPGQTYYYRLYAVDQGGGESTASSVAWDEALDLAPAAPTGLSAVEGAGEGEVDVSWDANGEPDLDHYRVERDTSSLFGPGTSAVDTSETSLLDAGLDPDTYFYRVIAVDGNANESAPSDTVSITLEQTGIEEDLVASVSFVRPNPFTTQTTIRYTVPSPGADVAMRLYDIRGRLVKTLIDRTQGGGAYELAWDGRDSGGRTVSSGIYFVQVSIGDVSETRKVAFVR